MTRAQRLVQLLSVTAASSATAFASTALGPLQETMRVALALSDNQMAVLQGPARATPMLLGAIPLGLLVDRKSRVRLVSIFAVLDLIASIATAGASNFAWLFAARWFVGLAAAATLMAAISLIADLYEPATRGRALMVMGVCYVGGAAAAFALGGSLVAAYGNDPDAWRKAILWLCCPLLVVMCALLPLREPARTGVLVKNPSALDSLVELWKFRALLVPLLGGVVIVEVAFGAAYIWVAPVFARNFGLSPDRVGQLLALVLLISGPLGGVIGGFLADLGQRVGGPRRTVTFVTALALSSIPAGLFAIMNNLTAATIVLLVLLTTLPAISGMVTTLFTILVPNELRGLGTAVMNAACVCFAYALAPLAVSLLSEAMGGATMIGRAVATVCVCTCAAGTGIFAVGTRNFPRG